VTPEGPVVLATDERLVRLIFVNLVSNAIKYTDEGRVTARVTVEDGEVRVAVEDTGRGITPEDQRRLFEPFRQLEPIQHKTTPGLGLGLWLVKELAAALRSKVSVDSEPGRGSTFALNLVPLRE
jgi:signal transduction histidine kinase